MHSTFPSSGEGLSQALINVNNPSDNVPDYQATHNHQYGWNQQPAYAYGATPAAPSGTYQQSVPGPPITPVIPARLAYVANALRLPPYPSYPRLREKWRALSRLSQFFMLIILILYPLSFIHEKTRLVGAFLPLVMIPTLILYRVYLRYYQHVEINLLLNTYMIAFSIGALIVLILETAVTALFALITIFDQLSDIWKALQQQQQSGQTPTNEDILPGARITVGFYFFVFFLSYCSAACVEEGLKYYMTVRIKKKTPGYRDKQGFLLYAVTGALGFSTVENIGYSFSVIAPVLDVFLNIMARILISTPVHLSTAYLIGIGIVRRDVYGEPLRLWRIMLIPVLLHGTFDFGLILASSLLKGQDLIQLAVNAAIVICTAVAIVVAIRWERKKIAGEPPVLPMYQNETRDSNIPQPQLASFHQEQQEGLLAINADNQLQRGVSMQPM